MTPRIPLSPLLANVAAAAFLVTATACSSSRICQAESPVATSQPGNTQEVQMNQPPLPPDAPPAGNAVRVGGELGAMITGCDGDFRSGPCRIDTPLPAGYPAPTPPGAIDLKTYPSVRLAEVKGSGSPDSGMNRAFWPLFNHIKEHNIAMTSPVEMNYSGVGSDRRAQPTSWSMAFLYRTPDLNATGTEGSVAVRDADPVTVLAVGIKGDYSMSLVERGMRQLEDWLSANPSWEAAGDWRSLYYNGPTLLFWNKWAEVQIPVRRSAGVPQPSSVANTFGTGSGQ